MNTQRPSTVISYQAKDLTTSKSYAESHQRAFTKTTLAQSISTALRKSVMVGSLVMGSVAFIALSGCASNEAPEQELVSGNSSSSSSSSSANGQGAHHSSHKPDSEVDAIETEVADVGLVDDGLVEEPHRVDVRKKERAMEAKVMSADRLSRMEMASGAVAGNTALSKSYHIAPQTIMPAPGFVPPHLPEPQPVFDQGHLPSDDLSNEKYADIEFNSVKSVVQEPVSTFSIDVDTGSYSNIRRILNQGVMPPKNAVRIEEMVNYFDYDYPQPDLSKAPFSVNTELAQAPWSDDHLLLRVGLQGFEPVQSERPHANLVFLLDVSGSMNSADKLPLLKKSLLMLTNQLSEDDKVSIVVYAGASGVVLEPTAGNEKFKIEQALQKLQAGGSTNGHQGIQLAYRLAEQSFVKDGINRVLLATDGDFNVGLSDTDALKDLIESKRKKGISLTTLGFGTGNYNDHLMEQLADVGNGNYAYIDTLHEARKVLVEELNATLMTIAKDVKIQLEFNPQWVAEYRLIGYENRMLAREDFNNDKVDSGEIGAGHKVTAIYELALVDSDGQRLPALRYQQEGQSKTSTETSVSLSKAASSSELGFLKLRYKAPDAEKSQLIETPIQLSKKVASFANASQDFRFAAVVAGFGQKLRQDKYLNGFDYQDMVDQAQKAKGNDPFGYRNEFIQLVRLADSLSQ
ncbi:von Willebrand factor type A domain-containing protein [Litoribrevibacter euphylliae]|uniref:von Willebrand factor type A domain-containing protein n=1 Tax=Litoribrevibacter euphylliae TaxID=1834034 RepID=A0ABV7HF01_9GAMM